MIDMLKKAEDEFKALLKEQGLPDRGWYTVTETARILGLSVSKVRSMCSTRIPGESTNGGCFELEARKTPDPSGHWRINRSAIADYLWHNHTYSRAGE